MFESIRKIESERIHKYGITRAGSPIAYADVLNLWQRDGAFCGFFNSLFRECPFSAYRWETPPITSATATRPFEFVLLDSPGLSRPPDRSTYAEHFTDGDIVSFKSLGKDATLVAPNPSGPGDDYAHLGAFIRNAPESQASALWRTVGEAAQRAIARRKVWVSTAGGGVAWLHVRIDSRPKYYGYEPYKNPA